MVIPCIARFQVAPEKDYFGDLPDQKIDKEMVDLAAHIVKTKQGHFKPAKYQDRYEEALKALLKKKAKGAKIERPKEEKPSNVINLTDALRRSVKGEAAASREQRKPAREHRTVKRPSRSSARHRKAG